MEPITDYDYDLPKELIAQEPLARRDASRLMWLDRASGDVRHLRFWDIADILKPGDLLVVNDTRVSAVRLFGRRPTGAKVELLLVKKTRPGEYVALAKPGRRLRPGAEIELDAGLKAIVQEDLADGSKQVRIVGNGDVDAALQLAGSTPLPPYIHRAIVDPERYQTVYSVHEGSAAAPTAGLHFSADLLDRLQSRGVLVTSVTLNVGLDTFRPIESPDAARHEMHGETCCVPEETAMLIERCEGRVVAVGTTSARTLESFATGPRKVSAGSMETRLYIRPGHRFQVIDGLITNFHLPRTSMLLLVSALGGKAPIQAAYAEAVRQKYRFLSFGDAMLIL